MGWTRTAKSEGEEGVEYGVRVLNIQNWVEGGNFFFFLNTEL